MAKLLSDDLPAQAWWLADAFRHSRNPFMYTNCRLSGMPFATTERASKQDLSALRELTLSLVAVVTDVIRDGRVMIGYCFNSNGRYGQGSLIREHFRPRVMEANPASLLNETGDNIDPHKVWACMMTNEKPGGHGERSVTLCTIDMALWDAVAKIEGKPLCEVLAQRYGNGVPNPKVFVHAAGGYYHPGKGLDGLRSEMTSHLERAYSVVKMKIGGASVAKDMERIEAVLKLLQPGQQLAVDVNGRFDLAITAGLGLGGNESYPDLFQPCGGFPDGVKVENG